MPLHESGYQGFLHNFFRIMRPPEPDDHDYPLRCAARRDNQQPLRRTGAGGRRDLYRAGQQRQSTVPGTASARLDATGLILHKRGSQTSTVFDAGDGTIQGSLSIDVL
jgi:hypothetical protein